MPRKKKAQPEPLERWDFEDFELEVRDAGTWLIGRGLHKQKDWELRTDQMLESIFSDYFRQDPYSEGKLKWRQPLVNKDYVRSATALAFETQASATLHALSREYRVPSK